MDHYSLERQMLERHRAMASRAEARTRAWAWSVQPRLAGLMAARLRSLADRLDRPEPGLTVVSGSR